MEGSVLIKDIDKAFGYYNKSCDLGEPSACLKLAYSYLDGDRMLQDYKTAIKYFRKAAELGDSEAMYKLGEICWKFAKISSSENELRMNVRESASFNPGFDYDAELNAVLTFGKTAETKDFEVQAHMWFNLAVANGFNRGSYDRSSIEEDMSLQQITQAQKLAREWQQRHKNKVQ